MQKDANDQLNTYERSFDKKLRTRPLRFLLPRVGLTLLAALVTLTIAVQSAYGSNANNGGSNKGVQGQVQFAVQATQLHSANWNITLNLQNVPPGKHRADIHQGTCPLNFTLNGQPAPFGPFTPGVTLPLGLVQANANGILKQTLTLQVGGTTGIPVNFLQTDHWFLCIHTGTLAQVTGNTPAQQFASLQKFLATPSGPGLIKPLVCQPLNAPQSANKLTLNFQGTQQGANPGKKPSPATPGPPTGKTFLQSRTG